MALKPVGSGPSVVVCNTCRHTTDQRTDADGVSGGARLFAALRAAQADNPDYAGIAVQEMACLLACQDFCTIHLRAPGKIGYVLGKFEPTVESARAILDYAVLYAGSEIGQVPYRDWPEGVKGHFITRSPPEGFVIE